MDRKPLGEEGTVLINPDAIRRRLKKGDVVEIKDKYLLGGRCVARISEIREAGQGARRKIILEVVVLEGEEMGVKSIPILHGTSIRKMEGYYGKN